MINNRVKGIMRKLILKQFVKLFNSLLKEYEEVLKKYLLETSIDDFETDEQTLNWEINKFAKKRDFWLRLLG
jgi:hypothetical protein